MKKIFFISLLSFLTCTIQAQEFAKQLTAARTAYAGGKLDEARFAMQQMLQELDIITGKEILKLLPTALLTQNSNATADNVSGASGFAGVVIHRDYSKEPTKKIELDIITNSPLLASINSLLSLPFVGNSGDNKVIKISGYKGLLQKSDNGNGIESYEVQLPINSSLITLKAPGYSKDDVLKMANSLPVNEIAKLIQ
jgi:hypothetical protein